MSDHQIVAERQVGRRISDDLIRQQVQHCASLSLKGTRGQGWSFKLGRIDEVLSTDGVRFRVTISYSPTSRRSSVLDKWGRICTRFAQAGCAGSLRKHPWVVCSPGGYEKVASEAQVKQEQAETRKRMSEEPKTLGDVSLDTGNHFVRIFGRDAQIRRIIDALNLGLRTGWRKRTNSLLDGPPGCGKSEIMLCLARMLGQENEAWRWFDATSMTKAGAIEEIIGSRVVPPVLFIEEIEKCEESALRWLLGVMDTRGQIRRTNYRVGNEARNVRMVVIASANDVKLLKKVMSGALYSRFQNKIYCPEPDRAIMEQILLREIVEIKGDQQWVEPTLKFAYDKWCISDPRDVINIMSCGGKRLLTGAAQADYEATMHPLEKRSLLVKRKKRQERAKKVADTE